MDGQSKERANQWERGFGLETDILGRVHVYMGQNLVKWVRIGMLFINWVM